MDHNRFQPFDAVKTDLQPGINLIEASAGTGKTFAIAMLALRFVVELDLRIEQLLIVTFTKAATEELKERIRARLAGAKRAMDGQIDTGDAVLAEWVQNLAVDKALARQRLQLALLDIDRAGIFTIHGFCQRVLHEHALESGQVFDAELSGDLHAIRRQIADDFWRLRVVAATAPVAALLMRYCKTPDELLQRVGKLADDVPVFPDDCDLDAALAAVFETLPVALAALPAIAAKVSAALPDGCFKNDYHNTFEGRLQDLENWLQSGTANLTLQKSLFIHPHPKPFATAQHKLLPEEEGVFSQADNATKATPTACLPLYLLQDPFSIALFTRQTLLDGLNGTKFRSNQMHSSEARKQQYLDELQLDTEPFDAMHKAMRQLDVAFRCAFVRYLRTERDKALQRLNVLSFDELVGRLAAALRSERAAWLQHTLRERFKAALIDEFQDTDQQQWHIFSTLFGGGAYLYLIGDPKQAIYKFRGADIFSYFEALRQADRHFTLEKNWRSQPLLVEAVNAVFERHPRPFWFDGLHFINVQPGVTEERADFSPPLQWWQLAPSEAKDGYWSAGKARQIIQAAVVEEILRLCRRYRPKGVTENREESLLISPNPNLNPQGEGVTAQDIAILVRTNQTAREYQQALQAAGVAAVLNSVESVFATPEARCLYVLLEALAHPGDTLLLKQALALPWFDLDGQALYLLGNDEAAMDAWMLRVQEYYRHWQSAGLMAMMLDFMRRENIHVNLARRPEAERQIANIQHLLELLQQACINEHLGQLKALDWLLAAIADAEHNAAEEQLVRLESDAQAVQIVTLHRAKGLEYAVVFCPDLWQRSDRLAKQSAVIECHENGSRIADLGSEQFAARLAQALQEELAEDLRIVYVALTRAKYRCYVAWADVRSKDKANTSAMAYLLFSDGGEDWQASLKNFGFSLQQQRLQGFSTQSPAFGYRLLEAKDTISASEGRRPAAGQAGAISASGRTEIGAPSVAAAALAARTRSRQLYSDWQMSSYTALAALSRHEAPELPEDKAQESYAAPAAGSEDTEMELLPFEKGGSGGGFLPKGAHTGNVVHALLETLSFRSLAAREEMSAAREQACLRYGLQLEAPQVIDALLQTVVRTPLAADDAQFTLANLDERHCLKEMPFYMSLPHFGAERINALLDSCAAFQPLQRKQLQGFLTGFIDLVCAYKGRYYVLDYKTNALAGYDTPQLVAAMRAHNYGLQYWIYTLVLHRYLQHRHPDYSYAEHFGGVRYLFVRGMSPDQPMRGVYQDIPDYRTLVKLEELFGTTHDSRQTV